jgi:hypothetical protein
MARVTSRLFSRRLQQGEHSLQFSVDVNAVAGWQVHEERDDTPILQRTYDDWHRVELAMSRFAIEASRLLREGWQEA